MDGDIKLRSIKFTVCPMSLLFVFAFADLGIYMWSSTIPGIPFIFSLFSLSGVNTYFKEARFFLLNKRKITGEVE